jgi:heat shock protein HslJ
MIGIGLIALSLLLVACGGDANGGGDNGGDGGAPTDGGAHLGPWQLESGIVDSDPVPLVDGYRITLTVDDTTLGGTAACNGYGADYTRSGGAGIEIDGLSWTEMACMPDEVMASEQAYLGGLVRVDEMAVEDRMLVLSGPDVELRFDRLDPVQTEALIGVTWVLETVVERESATSAGGEGATLRLEEDGTLTGGTGCRSLEGTYIVTGDEVLFTGFSADGECTEDLRRQDNQVVSVLGDGFTVVIEGDTLTITSAGDEQLVYRAER